MRPALRYLPHGKRPGRDVRGASVWCGGGSGGRIGPGAAQGGVQGRAGHAQLSGYSSMGDARLNPLAGLGDLLGGGQAHRPGIGALLLGDGDALGEDRRAPWSEWRTSAVLKSTQNIRQQNHGIRGDAGRGPVGLR